MATYDVIVVGLGAMGSAAAHHLARRGARVLGLEQFGVAHDRGSSHGRTRAIRQAYYEGPDYVPLLLRAYDLWRELEREAGASLLAITGALYMGTPDAPGVAGAELSARTHHIPYDMLSTQEIRTQYPVLRPRPDHVGLFEYQAGILKPEECVSAHIAVAGRRGADLHFNEEVTSWTADGDRVAVRTVRGTYEAGHLILTAGPWTGQALADLALPLRVERVVMYWFEPRDRREQLATLPIYAWDIGGINAYGFPYIEGQGLKVAFHQAYQEVTTPRTIRRKVGDDEAERMRAHLAELIPDAAGPLRAAATCMYTNTPDFHFIIDRHPAHANVALACGFSGHGFKFASVVGETLADLILRGETAHPIGLFALSRFATSAA